MAEEVCGCGEEFEGVLWGWDVEDGVEEDKIANPTHIIPKIRQTNNNKTRLINPDNPDILNSPQILILNIPTTTPKQRSNLTVLILTKQPTTKNKINIDIKWYIKNITFIIWNLKIKLD